MKDLKFLIASSDGRGFITKAQDVIAATKTGKQVLQLGNNCVAVKCVIVTGDHIGVVGTNRKLIIFSLSEIPEMRRGRGVILQKYRDAQLSDVCAFKLSEGLSWQSGGRTRSDPNSLAWKTKRGQVGRMVPSGFPKNNRFG